MVSWTGVSLKTWWTFHNSRVESVSNHSKCSVFSVLLHSTMRIDITMVYWERHYGHCLDSHPPWTEFDIAFITFRLTNLATVSSAARHSHASTLSLSPWHLPSERLILCKTRLLESWQPIKNCKWQSATVTLAYALELIVKAAWRGF